MSGKISKATFLSIAIGHREGTEPDWGSQGRYIDPNPVHKNATADPVHACLRCSKLDSILSQMASNPPGFDGVETPRGLLGNAHIDYGWLAAVRMLKDKMEQEG